MKASVQDFALAPASAESNSLGSAGTSQQRSGPKLALTSQPSLSMLTASNTPAELEIGEKQPPKEPKAATAAVAATAAPVSHNASLAASIGKSKPPQQPSPLQADAVETAKVKNQNVRRNVYISGIPPVYRSEEFRQLCMQFGRVEAAKLCVDNRNAPTKAYGFALYYSEESAAAAIRGLNGSFLQGRCVQARLADSHATPQPLGDEGSAANTTIPPPSHHQHRYDQREGRGNSGSQRKGRNSNNNRRGVSPANAGAVSSPGMQSGLPTPPYTAIPAGAALLTPVGEAVATPVTAIPADMSAYYPFMFVIPSTTTPPSQSLTATPTVTPPLASTSATPATNTRNVSPSNGSHGTDGGFGAVGTPITNYLSAGGAAGQPATHTTAPVISPASMTLSPPLASSQPTDSCGSLSLNASLAATANAATATTTLPGQQDMQQHAATTTPYHISFQPQPQSQSPQQAQKHQPVLPGSPGQVAIMAGAGAEGTQTFVYYPVPTSNSAETFAATATGNGVPQAPLQGMAVPAMPMANATGGRLPGSLMYFAMPQGAGASILPQIPQQMPVTPQPTFLPMPPSPPPVAAIAQNGLPTNYVMFDNNNAGMQFQILRQA
ncbi:putative RNA-binding protein [Leptomonas seymouri]|uniref:Putative RNA-binding protein n=1 Tax=Leptomonas seymouri TaxID=5684 RepID=A0A0N0P747_LEPSE|nr:putative RNA-binding protein [Leptomonas seymouri]|eukprot:KPI87907.1 putative RNA-binding protein [Leptomonas seymouri]